MAEGPVDPKYREALNGLANDLDNILNGGLKGEDRTVGFALLLFDFNAPVTGRVNYISNADRRDMIQGMKSWIEQAEAREKKDG